MLNKQYVNLDICYLWQNFHLPSIGIQKKAETNFFTSFTMDLKKYTMFYTQIC